MVGSAILRKLNEKKYNNILIDKNKTLDFRDQRSVYSFLKKTKPDLVCVCAAKVGGIYDNMLKPAEYLYDNISISINLINGCYKNNIKNIIFMGSSCIYPRETRIPIKETQLLDGALEKTNEGYSIAKIAGLKMCEFYNRQYKNDDIDYRALMPTNLYGINDKYDSKTSHVIPSLIKKFHEAKINNKKTVSVWGDGSPKREFLNVDDLADAFVKIINIKRVNFYKNKTDNFHINVGSGEEITIKHLAHMIKKITQFKGKIIFDRTKPNGTIRKKLSISRIKKFNWKAKITLKKGLKATYEDYVNRVATK